MSSLGSDALYPMTFLSRSVHRPWGGYRLGDGPVERVGERWLLSSVAPYATVISNGPLRGVELGEAVRRYGAAILGRSRSPGEGVFPLLIKLIDAAEDLSVQVHPDDAHAAPRGLPSGKDEFWVVLESEPLAQIYLGFRDGTSREGVLTALHEGRLPDLLRVYDGVAGSVYNVPGGTIHSIGAHNLILEIQQPSDTTYRLYDWGRVDEHGQGRILHVEEALDTLDFSASAESSLSGLRLPLGSVCGAIAASEYTSVLVDQEHFTIGVRWVWSGAEVGVRSEGLARVVLSLGADLGVSSCGGTVRVGRYVPVLLPAGLEEVRLEALPSGSDQVGTDFAEQSLDGDGGFSSLCVLITLKG